MFYNVVMLTQRQTATSPVNPPSTGPTIPAPTKPTSPPPDKQASPPPAKQTKRPLHESPSNATPLSKKRPPGKN